MTKLKRVNPDKIKVFCKVCKEEMTYEHNALSLSFLCENPECKAYLRRTNSYGKDFFGRIEMYEGEYEKKKK